MAKRSGGARPVQVGEQIRQCLGEMLLEGAVKDRRVSAASMVTITEVRMTPDLKLGRVLVSVFPDDEPLVLEVFAGLESAKNQIKKEVSRRLRLRYTPELRFLVDDSMAYGARIEAVLKEIAAERGEDPDADESEAADTPEEA